MKPKRIVTDVKATIEFPHVYRLIMDRYGTPKYWDTLEKRLQWEIDDFETFMHDHRSRDSYRISIEREYTDVCPYCNYEWEVDNDGCPVCCGEAIREWQAEHEVEHEDK